MEGIILWILESSSKLHDCLYGNKPYLVNAFRRQSKIFITEKPQMTVNVTGSDLTLPCPEFTDIQ